MSGMLKKIKVQNYEKDILSKDELNDIKQRIYDIKEEIVSIPKENNKTYFEKVKKLGLELASLQKRLRKGLKANKLVKNK